MAGRHNLAVDSGATCRFTVTLRDADDDPYDLTGCVCSFGLSEFDGASALRAVDSSAVELTITPLTGTIAVHLPASFTKNLHRGRYDLEVTWPSGDITRVLAGTLAVHEGAGT